MRFRQVLITSTFCLLAFCSRAQDHQPNSAEIKLSLEKLNVLGGVLYIAAHPDDENTRLLAYLAKERKVKTGYLSLTRGDGGQNLIGNEQAEMLGLIRTQELLAARRVDGAEQFFTRANDFGFSKTSEETLAIWDKEKVLADVVWVIRKFKPDVIVTRFPEDSRAGHGHHASSAILAREAFFAAADPKRFPEQLQYVKAWKAKRLVWNTFNFNSTNNTTSEDQLKINVGLYNPLLGKSYGEIAAESRTNHKSQGFGTASQRGDVYEYFLHIAGDKASTDLLEGVDLSWNKVSGGAAISSLLQNAIKTFDITEPSKSAEILLKAKRLIKKTSEQYKAEEIDNAILACLGIWAEVNTAEPQFALGDSIPVRLQAIARVPANFKPAISLSEELTKLNNIALESNKAVMLTSAIKFASKNTTQPFWLEKDHPLGSYILDRQQLVGKPEDKNDFSALFTFKIGDDIITLHKPVLNKYTDQVRGEIYQPLVVAPPVTMTPETSALIFKAGETKKINLNLQSFKSNNSGIIKVSAPTGWTVIPEQVDYNFSRKGETTWKEFAITSSATGADGDLSFTALSNGEKYGKGFKEIKYNHIPTQTIFPTSKTRLEIVDLKSNVRKLAYLPGAGDLVAESLKQIGYDVSILSNEEVLKADLSAFDAIVTGVRFYNVNTQITSIQPKLLEYVKSGGILLVQYNRDDALQTRTIGPYPFAVTRNRVSEEDAEVSILEPNHKLLNYPNKITNKDFESWVQERSTYLPANIDKAYTSLLGMSDKGENPGNGSLLVADYGKGRFVYTSLAFFRQLPAGIPGAYRLFVNLISK